MVKQLFILVFGSLLLASCIASKQLQKEPEKKTALSDAVLQGTWVLTYVIASADVAVLYPDRKPELLLDDITGGTFHGTSGCNRIEGKIAVEGSKMTFTDPVAITRMMCPGDGEKAFFAALKRVNHCAVNPAGNELTCIQGDILVMRFQKK